MTKSVARKFFALIFPIIRSMDKWILQQKWMQFIVFPSNVFEAALKQNQDELSFITKIISFCPDNDLELPQELLEKLNPHLQIEDQVTTRLGWPPLSSAVSFGSLRAKQIFSKGTDEDIFESHSIAVAAHMAKACTQLSINFLEKRDLQSWRLSSSLADMWSIRLLGLIEGRYSSDEMANKPNSSITLNELKTERSQKLNNIRHQGNREAKQWVRKQWTNRRSDFSSMTKAGEILSAELEAQDRPYTPRTVTDWIRSFEKQKKEK